MCKYAYCFYLSFQKTLKTHKPDVSGVSGLIRPCLVDEDVACLSLTEQVEHQDCLNPWPAYIEFKNEKLNGHQVRSLLTEFADNFYNFNTYDLTTLTNARGGSLKLSAELRPKPESIWGL